MSKRYLLNAVLGPLSERPTPSNATAGASETPFGLYIDTDTGDVYEATGSEWTNIGTLAGNGATSISGLVSDGSDGIEVSGDVAVGGGFTAAGNVNATDITADGAVDSLGGYTVPTPDAPVAAPTLSAADSPGGVPIADWLYAIAWHDIGTGFNTPLGPTAFISLGAESAVTVTPPAMPASADGYYIWRSADAGTTWYPVGDGAWPQADLNPGTDPVIDTQAASDPSNLLATPTSTGMTIDKDGHIVIQLPPDGNHWVDIHTSGGGYAFSIHNDRFPEHAGGVFQVSGEGNIEAQGNASVDGSVSSGNSDSTTTDRCQFWRQFILAESPGQETNGNPTLDVFQGVVSMTQDRQGQALNVNRKAATNGFNYLDPVALINDSSTSHVDTLQLGTDALSNWTILAKYTGEVVFGYGVGAYNVTPPASQPTMTLTTSTITDAVAKTVISALVGIINGAGLAAITEN